MPIYEYKCTACGHDFELIESVSEKRKKKCPECGKFRAEKQVSLAGFQLKGSGWFADGYSKDKPPAKDKPKTKKSSSETKKKSKVTQNKS